MTSVSEAICFLFIFAEKRDTFSHKNNDANQDIFPLSVMEDI